MNRPMPEGDLYAGEPLIVVPSRRLALIQVPERGKTIRVPMPQQKRLAQVFRSQGHLFIWLTGEPMLRRFEPESMHFVPTELPTRSLWRGHSEGLLYSGYRSPILLQKLCNEGLAEGKPRELDPRTYSSPEGLFGKFAWRRGFSGLTGRSLDGWDTQAQTALPSLEGLGEGTFESRTNVQGDNTGNVWVLAKLPQRGLTLWCFAERYRSWDEQTAPPHGVELHGPLLVSTKNGVFAPAGNELWFYSYDTRRWEQVISEKDWLAKTGHAAPKYPHYAPTTQGRLWVSGDPGLWLFDPERRTWTERLLST